jgi:predicted lipid-binding transport protein (Tim44 family)
MEIRLKTLLVAVSVAIAGLTLVAPMDAEAKRLGGGKPAGMQRQAPAKAPEATPATPANPAAAQAARPATPAAAPATPPKRNWMGPLAGLAAGLGLAALFSHFGLGEGMSNILMMVLLAGVAFFAIRWIMGRMAGGARGMGGPQLAGAGAGAGAGASGNVSPAPFGQVNRQEPTMQRDAFTPAAVAPASAGAAGAALAAAPLTLPGGMEAAEFERIAKQVFIRLQAANDAGNAEDLRRFTTPELFASLKADLLERGQATQKTDVVQLDAKLIDTAEENGQHIATVRFQGLIREAADAGAEPFDESWHLVRPVAGGGDWAIAGIGPTQ